MFSRNRGFTIVELLIVIVVIAILAAITIVAYNGIQNRAYDTTVQSDLKNNGSKTQQAMILNGELAPDASQAGLDDIVAFSKSAYYLRSTYSVVYCRSASGNQFGYVAASKSGNAYVYDSKVGSVQYKTTTASWAGSTTSGTCTNADFFNTADFQSGTSIGLLFNSAWLAWV